MSERSILFFLGTLALGLITAAILLSSCSIGPDPVEQTVEAIVEQTRTATAQATPEPTATNTPIPTMTATPTATPWIFPTPIWDPSGEWPYGLPEMVKPVEPAWEDDVEVYALLGSDYASWRINLVTGTDNTDAFLIVIANKRTETISIVSVPRDLYVFQPGFGLQRINTAWKNGGFEMVADTIRYNFGLPLDGYAYVRMEAFSRFVDDALHGIYVDVRNPVYDKCGDLIINLLPGSQFMDGPMALCYARVRMYDGGYARQTRQREVLQGMKAKFLELAADHPIQMAGDVISLYQTEHRYTNVDLADVLRLLPLALDAEILEYQIDSNIPGIRHFTHPVSGAWLIQPPNASCIYNLMWTATEGEPWWILEGGLCDVDP